MFDVLVVQYIVHTERENIYGVGVGDREGKGVGDREHCVEHPDALHVQCERIAGALRLGGW